MDGMNKPMTTREFLKWYGNAHSLLAVPVCDYASILSLPLDADLRRAYSHLRV